ncbi:MAG TPA: response regulator [Gammaproteobacteria bacterium]
MGIQTALVVDDSRSARYILQRLLERRQIHVEVADSAQQAFDYLREYRPDVVFMDDMMPGMDGNEAVDRLSADPRTAGIPVVMYTGTEYAAAAAQTPRRGVIGVLSKPFTQADVNALLARLDTAAPQERPQPPRLVRLPATAPHASAAPAQPSAEQTPGTQSLDSLRAQLADSLKIEARLAVEQLLGEELEAQVDARIERHSAVWRQSLHHVRLEQIRANSQLLDERLPRLLELLEQRFEERIEARIGERLQQHAAELEQRLNERFDTDQLTPLQRAQVAHIAHSEVTNAVDRSARQSARRVAAELMRGDLNALSLRLERLRRRFNSLVTAAAVAMVAVGVVGYLVGFAV